MGHEAPEIKFPEPDYKYVPSGQVLEGPTKGEGILKCIKNCESVPDCVISCDGSNAIPYENILNIFQELISDSGVHCVMANRKGNKAIQRERFLIERFEVYTVKRCCGYNGEIPDGQCGLWAYRAGVIRRNGAETEICLTAKGYAIELDLLSEALEKGLNYSFVDVELPMRQTSSKFEYENNLKKMRFLLEKFKSKKLAESLCDYVKDFERGEEFKMLASKNMRVKPYWKGYKASLFAEMQHS